uniref:Antitoxin component of toxin-antitoxin stability system, DNA-binding transcriptional repressor n=1 Tax=Candidatus Kentrum sp. FM TaxID=2126340 RepID=A0A450S5E9_9GAMM|nr:MAG: Antitoxin component of toxin-antitoxin stability system, DNA-binding transcriptional repressor [Candidatus Kentron sp. FM]
MVKNLFSLSVISVDTLLFFVVASWILPKNRNEAPLPQQKDTPRRDIPVSLCNGYLYTLIYTPTLGKRSNDMQASILDLRYNMKNVLGAIDRNEAVVITHRGKPRATLVPLHGERDRADPASHPFFGMNPPTEGDTTLADLRGGRFDAV